MKIQHLETLNTKLPATIDEILVTYLILLNALRCLPKIDGWILTKQVSRPEVKTDGVCTKQVVLSIDELQSKYREYVSCKENLLVQEFSSKLVLK